MHIFNNIRNFLYDNDNFIAILDNKIYLYNIVSIKDISNSKIVVLFDKRIINIIGEDLKVIKSSDGELEILGSIKKVLIDEIIN